MIRGLGKVVVVAAGTPVQVGNDDTKGSFISITPNPANVGNLYLGNAGMNKGTGAGVIAVIQKAANPFQVFTNSPSLSVNDFWLDADNANDFGYAAIAQ